jgi:uncharacterized membrane protein
MVLVITICVGAAFILWWTGRSLPAFLTPDFLLLGGLAINYLRAHKAAKSLAGGRAPQTPPPPAVASLEPSKPSLGFPAFTLVVGLVAGLFVTWYAWSHYDVLPDRMPTHFSGSGRPDAWSDKSFASVMVLPLTTLATGAGMGLLGLLLARAKRALRLEKKGVSLLAQQKYRTAIVTYICGLTLIATAMLGLMSVGAIQVGMGETDRLSSVEIILSVAVAVWAMAGALYIAIRLGQGGAKLEASVAHAPLTDGLADNDKWKLGAIYINRNDPSTFVEHRFGLGYTINFGNPKAIIFIVVLLAAIVIIPIWLSFSL